jgi:hypothetical protein
VYHPSPQKRLSNADVDVDEVVAPLSAAGR